MSEYMRRRAAGALAHLRRGRLAHNHDAARWFVEGCVRGRINPHATDTVIVDQLIEYLEREVVENPAFVVAADHRHALYVDAKLTAIHAGPPIGALILYATWLEHWANGLLILFGPRRGLEANELARLVKKTALERKLVVVPEAIGMRPLDTQLRESLAAIVRCRNQFVHFKWQDRYASIGQESDDHVRALVRGAEKWIPDLERHTRQSLYEPALTIAERLFLFDKEDSALSFV